LNFKHIHNISGVKILVDDYNVRVGETLSAFIPNNR